MICFTTTMVNHAVMAPGAHFTNNFFCRNSNLMDISFCCRPSCSKVIAITFCTWHNSCDFIPCAKFCNDMLSNSGVTLKPIFHQWIMMQKSVKVIHTSVSFYILSLIHALTLNVRGPSYFGLTRSISWLLMPWLLTSPGHQQPWYSLCIIGRFLSYLRKDLNYLHRINVEKWHKM